MVEFDVLLYIFYISFRVNLFFSSFGISVFCIISFYLFLLTYLLRFFLLATWTFIGWIFTFPKPCTFCSADIPLCANFVHFFLYDSFLSIFCFPHKVWFFFIQCTMYLIRAPLFVKWHYRFTFFLFILCLSFRCFFWLINHLTQNLWISICLFFTLHTTCACV